TVEAIGLGPGELRDMVLERAGSVPPGAVARLYVENVDPEAYRLLDLQQIRDVASAALHIQLLPTFVGVNASVSMPELESVPAQWDRYIGGQDLTGFDRDRVVGLGRTYLADALEEVDAWGCHEDHAARVAQLPRARVRRRP